MRTHPSKPSIPAVVGRFLGDLHVVDVGFAHPGAGDADELRLGAHGLDVGAAGVMIAAGSAVAVGIFIMGPPLLEKIRSIF